MTKEILQAQRELRSTLGVWLARPGELPEQWPDFEDLGKLVEFFSALWEHLRSFDHDDQWMRSLPDRPYAARVSELRHLYQQLLKTRPPAAMADALGEALEATLNVAADFVAGQEKFGGDAKPPAALHQHRDFLEGIKNMLIDRESELVEPVPAGSALGLSGLLAPGHLLD